MLTRYLNAFSPGKAIWLYNKLAELL